MRKTKVVLGGVALIIVAYSGSAWYVGKEAQKAIVQGVDQANERVVKMLGPDLGSTHFNVQIRDYQRGVFSSTAQYVIQTTSSYGEPMEYVLQDNLQHGPFPLSALRVGKLSPMLAHSQVDMLITPDVEDWFDLRQGQTPLHIETQLGFGGKGFSQWTLAPFEASRAERHVSFSGGHVRVVFNDGFNNNSATGHVDSYVLNDHVTGEKIELRDISLSGTAQIIAEGQFDHHSQAQINTLTITDDAGTSPVVIEDLDVSLSSEQRAGFLDAQWRYDFNRILLAGEDLGHMTAGGALKTLNLEALSDLQVTYAEMAAQRGPDTEPGFLLTPQEQLVLQEKLRPILAAEPSFFIEPLVWKNAAGQSQASASIVMRDPGETQDANVVEVLREAIATAKLDMTISRSMVVQFFQQAGLGDDVDPTQSGELGGQLFDEYAELLTQLGLVKRDSNSVSLSLDATPSEDKIILNGEEMTTEQLFMLAFGLLLL